MPKLKSKTETSEHGWIPAGVSAIKWFLSKFKPVPKDWIVKRDSLKKSKTIKCESFDEVIATWQVCMRWRDDLENVLVAMLSVVVSTEQIGDQLFLQVIGDAGSGKTRFCDAFLTSPTCHALEHITGFHSGFKGTGDEDYSLISRINRKTLITPEGDVMMSSPKFKEIMSQQRRIFDGTSGATYKNQAEDVRYTGLRTPWIIAGTPTLMDSDQSRLGDRFLRVCIESPDYEERRKIQRVVALSALTSVRVKSCAKDKKLTNSDMEEAYAKTGGYVSFLRNNAEDMIKKVEIPEDLIEQCCDLGEFTADFRARPNADANSETDDTKELPTRLTHQFVRLMCCVAACTQRKEADEYVMRIVKKIAIDSSRGRTLDIARVLFENQSEGLENKGIVNRCNLTPNEVRKMIRFMRGIGIVESFTVKTKTAVKGVRRTDKLKFRLTERVDSLMESIIAEEA